MGVDSAVLAGGSVAVVPGRPLSHPAQVSPPAKSPMGISDYLHTCCQVWLLRLPGDYYYLLLFSVIIYTPAPAPACCVRCGSCDGQCGPGNGCPCTACVELSGYEIKAGKAVKVWGGATHVCRGENPGVVHICCG